MQLGILAVLRGRLDEARPLLDEALDLSMTAHSTPFVTLCLAGYAQLAFADGHPDRAALLKGAAEGLRRRVGQPAWPHLRRAEGELAAQVRHSLGDSRFDQAISAGSRLTQREAGHRPGPLTLRDVRLPRHRQPLPGSYQDVIEMLRKRVIRFSFQLTLGIALEVLIEMAS